jgi:hypothetical protein
MRCKLGKQAIVEAVLDYLEGKYALSPAHNVSPLERIVRLRERGKWESVDEVWSVRSDEDDDDVDWNDWDKHN